MSNRTTLAQMREMDAEQVSHLPTDHLAMLLDETAALKADAAKLADKLSDALGLKFGSHAAALRKAEGKDTGRVSFDDADHIVRADLPKKVTWDQAGLTKAMLVIRDEWKEKPSDYMQVELKVAEAKYNAWPPAIRELFTDARTLSTGKLSFVIERKAS